MSAEDLRRNMSVLGPQGPDETAMGAGYSVAEPDLLAGLVAKATTSNTSARSYIAFPPDVVDKFGIPGVDAKSLSTGEKILLRKMGISMVPPRPVQVSQQLAALKSRMAEAQAAPAPSAPTDAGAGSVDWTKFMVLDYDRARFGVQPSHVTPDGKSVWLNRADIPPAIMGKLTPAQQREAPLKGMQIPLGQLSPEDDAWLGEQVKAWREQKKAETKDDVQKDPKALKKLMGQ